MKTRRAPCKIRRTDCAHRAPNGPCLPASTAPSLSLCSPIVISRHFRAPRATDSPAGPPIISCLQASSRYRPTKSRRTWTGPPACKAGHAIEIMTGAPVPMGADCVVMVEHAKIKRRRTVYRPRPQSGPRRKHRPRRCRSQSGSNRALPGTRIEPNISR